MRRDIIKDVEIKEPPLEELTRRYSTFSSIKRSCIGGCGCLVVLLIAFIVIIKVFLGVGPQNVSKVPNDFPTDIPIYDAENISEITFISGQYKNRAIEIAAIIPKVILSPLISALDKDMVSSSDEKTSMKNIWKIVNEPVGDKRNVVKVKWINMPAEYDFVYNHYKNELTKSDYIITATSVGENEKQFSFAKDSISGSFYVKINKEMTSTELANLIVNYYSSTSTQ